MLKRAVYQIVEANVAAIADTGSFTCQSEFEFVTGQLESVPGPARLGLKAASVLVWLAAGMPIRSLPSRTRQILWLNRTRIPLLHELASFYQSLTVFAHYQQLTSE